jgi:hypothetical protein
VNLTINGPDIAGVELTLSFDPGAFTIAEVREGGFLGQNAQSVARVQNIDNSRGTARVTLERAPGAPVVAGTGTLATLMLQPGKTKGPSTLRIVEFGVRDGRQVLHPGKPTEVQITVP